MAKTYRITIEYTDTEGSDWKSPVHWDWPEVLHIDARTQTFGVWVDEVKTNDDHVREITEFADANRYGKRV